MAVAVGVLLNKPHSQEAVSAAVPTDFQAASTNAPAREGTPSAAKKHLGPAATDNGAGAKETAPAPLNLATNWEEKVDEILGAEKEDREKARQMLELFPRVPAEGQAEVAQHLANLTPNEDYSSLAQFLVSGGVSEAAQDVLMADALNRPNGVKLPVLLEVARDPQNAKATEAKDVLQLFLEEDLGTDWTAWQMKLDQWLKDNPD